MQADAVRLIELGLAEHMEDETVYAPFDEIDICLSHGSCLLPFVEREGYALLTSVAHGQQATASSPSQPLQRLP